MEEMSFTDPPGGLKFSANHDQSWLAIIGKIQFCWVVLTN